MSNYYLITCFTWRLFQWLCLKEELKSRLCEILISLRKPARTRLYLTVQEVEQLVFDFYLHGTFLFPSSTSLKYRVNLVFQFDRLSLEPEMLVCRKLIDHWRCRVYLINLSANWNVLGGAYATIGKLSPKHVSNQCSNVVLKVFSSSIS
jgi:hypothetical protein